MTEPAFLAALAERPDDEATWLVYADWLEEQGGERHLFVRLLVELAHGASDEKQLASLRKQHKRLYRGLDPTWRDEIIRLRAALPLRFRIENISMGGQTPPIEMFDWARTFVFGVLEQGTIRVRMPVQVPFADRVEVMMVRHLFSLTTDYDARSAGEEPLHLTLMWPGHHHGIRVGDVIVRQDGSERADP